MLKEGGQGRTWVGKKKNQKKRTLRGGKGGDTLQWATKKAEVFGQGRGWLSGKSSLEFFICARGRLQNPELTKIGQPKESVSTPDHSRLFTLGRKRMGHRSIGGGVRGDLS